MSTTTEPDPAAAEEAEKRFSVVYFGYGSNLSPRTMKQRCPDSLFIGLGRLCGWRWQINETGYANIVPGEDGDEVYGSLNFLSHRDEAALDESEGVPWLYEKKTLKVLRVTAPGEEAEWGGQGTTEIEVMSYVDVQRTVDGRVEREYITWINKAIEDARKCGMPVEYADKYIKPFLPQEQDGLDHEIVMVRTTRFGEKDAGLVPRGFASWSRG